MHTQPARSYIFLTNATMATGALNEHERGMVRMCICVIQLIRASGPAEHDCALPRGVEYDWWPWTLTTIGDCGSKRRVTRYSDSVVEDLT